MKNDSQNQSTKIMQLAKCGGFSLWAFRAGLPGIAAKVGAVGKVQVVQWVAQPEPELPLECRLET